MCLARGVLTGINRQKASKLGQPSTARSRSRRQARGPTKTLQRAAICGVYFSFNAATTPLRIFATALLADGNDFAVFCFRRGIGANKPIEAPGISSAGWSEQAILLPLVYVLTSHVSFNKDRKSTRLNSSHRCISYAVFCLKKK